MQCRDVSRKTACAVAMTLLTGLAAAQTQVPNEFVDGTPASANAVNQNFDTLEEAVNRKQERVDGTCTAGSYVSAINGDGSVQCGAAPAFSDTDALGVVELFGVRVERQTERPFLSNAGTTDTENDHWQSFITDISGALTTIEVEFGNGGGAASIAIYRGAGIGGELLHSQDVSISSFAVNTFNLNAPVLVEKGSPYTFRISADSDIRIYHSNTDAYADGISSLCCNFDLKFAATTESRLRLSSPDGSCFEVSVDNAGQLETSAVACP